MTTSVARSRLELEPNRKHRYSAGLGYGTDTGARGRFKVERRWVNRMGHRYDAEVQFSQIKSLAGVKYRMPGSDPTTDEYTFTAGYVQQNYNQQDYETWTLGGGWQMQDGKWLKNYNLNFQYEQFQTGSEPEGRSLLLMPGLNWTWVSADDRLNTRRGLLLNVCRPRLAELRPARVGCGNQVEDSRKQVWPLLHCPPHRDPAGRAAGRRPSGSPGPRPAATARSVDRRLRHPRRRRVSSEGS